MDSVPEEEIKAIIEEYMHLVVVLNRKYKKYIGNLLYLLLLLYGLSHNAQDTFLHCLRISMIPSGVNNDETYKTLVFWSDMKMSC